MPRTLPWLQEKRRSSIVKQTTERQGKRQRTETPDLVDDDLNTTGVSTPERRAKLRPARTPSTSPPPQVPDVEYMREGFAADDVWRMVEDEFLSTAKLYTQHLHHAEYVRLKKLAKSRGHAAVQSIARATDGRTAQSTATKLRLEADANARRIKTGIRAVSNQDSSSEEDEPWMHDPQLAGLMANERASGELLTGVAKAKANTRAAAGFSQDMRRPKGNSSYLNAKSEAREVKYPKVIERTGKRQDDYDQEDEDEVEDEDDLDSAPRRKKEHNLSNSFHGTNTTADEQKHRHRDVTSAVDDVKPMSRHGREQNTQTERQSDGDKTPHRRNEALNPFKAVAEDEAAKQRARESAAAAEHIAMRRAAREKKAR